MTCPENDQMCFVAQGGQDLFHLDEYVTFFFVEPYLVCGSLADQLLYPSTKMDETISPAEEREVRRLFCDVGLGYLLTRYALNIAEDW